MPSFTEIAPLRTEISRHAEQVLTDNERTHGRPDKPNT